MGAPVVTLCHSCGQLTQPFNPFFKPVHSCQCPSVGLPGLSKFTVIGIIILQSSLRDLFSVAGCRSSGGSLFLISFWYGSTPLCWRCSSADGKMSWANSCTHSGPHSGGLGSLFSWSTSLYSPLISPQEVLYPTSWMVGTSALESSLGIPCQQPVQIACSISFHPASVACRNILWRMNRWWDSPAFHHGYSSRNRSASRWHSASLMDSLLLFASPLAASNLCLL